MVAKPWKCAMAVAVGLVLLLVAGCTRPQGNQTAGTTPAAESTATAQPAGAAQPTQGTTKVACTNTKGSDVDSVVVFGKSGRQMYPGTDCGIVWGAAVSGDIPNDKEGQTTLSSTVCVWMGDHWECGTTRPSTDSTAKPGVKK